MGYPGSGWGMFASALGAGLSGGVDVYQKEQDRKEKEKIAAATNELRLMVAQLQGNTRLAVEDKRTQRQQGRDLAKKEAITLALQNNLDVEGLKTDRAKTIQQMINDGKIDQEDAKYWHQLDYKEIDKEIAAARNASNERIGKGHDEASVTVGAGHDTANITVGAGHDTASEYGADQRLAGVNATQEGENQRATQQFPLRVFRANQGRYPRGNAAAKRAGSINQPTFGPSYEDFMRQGGAQFGPSPQLMPPPPQLPSANDMKMSPAPPRGLFPHVPSGIFAPQPEAPPPPQAPPVDDEGNPLAAPQPQPSLSSRGFFGGAPTPSGKSQMTADRQEAQANDLMARITQAQAKGDFQGARALKQQLADLVKQQD